jgi:Rrf2 family protein
MKISCRAQYAVRLMLYLAGRDGAGHVQLRDIARAEHISAKFLGQIVLPLRRRGLLRAARGARGGYALAKEPCEISVEDIVEAVEGVIALAERPGRAATATRASARCINQHVWQRASRALRRELAAVTLDKLCRVRTQFHDTPAGTIEYVI